MPYEDVPFIGEDTSKWFKYLMNLYNISSEQADLRSWQTLPAEIRLARFILEPGEYDLFYNRNKLGHMNVKEGEKKFVIYRTVA